MDSINSNQNNNESSFGKRLAEKTLEELKGLSDDPNSHHSGGKSRGKRRSKNDVDGRVHKCSFCDKTYLSYPALYTHMKTKHAFIKGPDGQPITGCLNNGRGRGRPRKIAKKIDPTSPEFFTSPDRKGGPTHVSTGFKEVFDSIYKEEKPTADSIKHPLFPLLQNYSESTASQKKDQEKKCDEIFVEYLAMIAKDVNEGFYKSVVTFALLFRDCLNIYGWQKKKQWQSQQLQAQLTGEGGAIPSTNSTNAGSGADEEEGKDEFTRVHNAEHAPEICNEFVTEYLDTKKINYDRELSIDLTRNFCNWLFQKGYTCSKLSMIS